MDEGTGVGLSGFLLARWIWLIFREPVERRAGPRYIATQEEHHREVSYQDEFRALCRKHGVEIDERYVWIEARFVAPRWGLFLF